jgi:hypothetical protein
MRRRERFSLNTGVCAWESGNNVNGKVLTQSSAKSLDRAEEQDFRPVTGSLEKIIAGALVFGCIDVAAGFAFRTPARANSPTVIDLRPVSEAKERPRVTSA